MALMKFLALILGSVWFFPVSCTGSFFAGLRVVAYLDQRDVSRGDEVHSIFTMVAEPGPNKQPFRAVRLHELQQRRDEGEVHFLMSQPSGRIDVNAYTSLSYRVVRNLGSEQVIEVEDKTDDRTLWSTYRATSNDVTPLSSRMVYFGYMFTAFPFAIGTAVALYGTGRFLRQRLQAGTKGESRDRETSGSA